jgi:hypothetical protein
MNAAKLAAFLKSLDMALADMPPQAQETWLKLQIEYWQGVHDRRQSDEIISHLRERLAAVAVRRDARAAGQTEPGTCPEPAPDARFPHF